MIDIDSFGYTRGIDGIGSRRVKEGIIAWFPPFAAEYLVRKRQRPRRHVMSVDVYGRVVDFRVKGLIMGQGSMVKDHKEGVG